MIYSAKRKLPNELFEGIEYVFGFTKEEVIDKDRSEPIASIRLMVMHLLESRYGWNISHIGPALGRHRSTPIARMDDHEARMMNRVDPNYKESFEALQEYLNDKEDK